MTRRYLLHEQAKGGMNKRATCEKCGKRSGVQLRIKLDPRTFRIAQELRLCTPCGKTLEFAPKYASSGPMTQPP